MMEMFHCFLYSMFPVTYFYSQLSFPSDEFFFYNEAIHRNGR